MTLAARPTYDESLEAVAQLRQVQMWRAAQTVRAHVTEPEQADMLDCLGLSDAVRPAGL